MTELELMYGVHEAEAVDIIMRELEEDALHEPEPTQQDLERQEYLMRGGR